ncbi:MAG: thioredoxin-disulfide reductase [Chloroflexi bacterium]|nr:thioredoxin-disulfide reductase [Chloroflexota bacterium]
MSETYDVIIIGSGPAGYTAAIYASRASLKVLILAGGLAGGQLMLTSDVENFPGFEEGIIGPELMDKLQRQATRFGAELLYEDVTSVDFGQGSPFTVSTDSATYQGGAIIIATGASARWLELPSETRLRGRGVSTCATCDGFFFRNRKVMVIGGGDSALEEALYLSKMASAVTLVHRRDAFRASKIMQQRIFDNPKISVIWDSTVEEVLGDEAVTAVRLRHVTSGALTDVPVDGLFVAIGHDPNTGFLAGAVQTDAAGYIVPVEHTMTSVPGVFAAGDVVDTRYRQAVTAAGDGCRAAIDAERWLEAHVHSQAAAAHATT